MTKRSVAVRYVVGLMATSFLCSVAQAQAASQPRATTQPATAEAALDAQVDSPAELESNLGDIVVTARKREETLQSVPATISAVTGDLLADAGVNQLSDISKQVTGLGFAQLGGAQPLLSVRGDFNRIGSFVAGTGIFVEGAYATRFLQLGQTPIDVDRVEVLKGPQSTLYGKNTIAGAINIIYGKPTFDWHGSIEAGYGQSSVANENIWHAQAMISGPLIDDLLAVRFVASHSERDGFLRDRVSGIRGLGYDVDTYRAKLLFRPASGLEIELTGSYTESDIPRADNLLFQPGRIVPYSRAGFNQAAVTFGPTIWDWRSDVVPYSRSKNWYVNGEIRLDTPIGQIVSITNYQHSRLDQLTNLDTTQFLIARQQVVDRDSAFAQELRLVGAGGGFQWLAGLYYLNDRDTGLGQRIDFLEDSTQRSASGIARQVVDVPTLTKTYAAFGQLGYDITNKLNVLGGLRYSEDHLSAPFNFAFVRTDGTTPGAINNLERKRNFSSLTGNATVTYRPNRDVSVYGSYSTGTKAGGFGTAGSVTGALISFEEQFVRAYEVGVKSDLLGRTLRLNVSAFLNKYSNLQIARNVTVTDAGGNVLGTFNVTQNAARSRVPGVDVEAVIAPNRNFRVGINYTYQDAKIFDYVFDSTPRPGLPNGIILQNVPIPRSPKHTINTSVNYNADLGDGRLSLGANLAFKSSFSNDIAVVVPSTVLTAPLPSYETVNLQAGYEWSNFELRGYVNNVFNRQYAVSAQIVSPAFHPLQTPGEPRTFEITAKYKF